MAKANIGSIAYHFGGKEGLHAACADYIVETIQAHCGAGAGRGGKFRQGRGERAAAAFAAVERMVSFIVASPEAGDIVQFVLRELSQPTAALDRIYARRVRADASPALPDLAAGDRRGGRQRSDEDSPCSR